jgi:outer membrane protein OmpA-like peptidoglycan-associated protein
VRLGGQAGVLVRGTATTLDATVGSQLLYGGAALVRLQKGLEVLGEVVGRSGLEEFTQRWWDQNPVEADVAARVYPMGMLAITGGIGAGFGKGIGAPKGRLFLGAVFTPDFRDADQDGVYDSEDRCPDQAEDRDGFKDRDGCPEPDNDNDGLPDVNDKCPNDAEDMDQFQDEDGCPELDNDKDGIPDLNDPCPNAAEDGRGKKPKDGCPSTAEDQDGDTVNDTIDKCPDEPEDRDLFQDDDGCPDPDNDGDGIPDGFDNCPNEAEDADNFEDEDGCPEPDNDKDGFPDAADKCPDKAETLNGKQDDDGCPDDGPEFVKLLDDSIEFSERLHYTGRGGRSELRESSAHAVGLIALVLKGHPEIQKLRIEVQTDGISRDETQRRAELIRDAIVRRGVDAGRLVPVGVGGGGSRLTFIIAERKVPKPAAPAAAPTGKPADASGAGIP